MGEMIIIKKDTAARVLAQADHRLAQVKETVIKKQKQEMIRGKAAPNLIVIDTKCTLPARKDQFQEIDEIATEEVDQIHLKDVEVPIGAGKQEEVVAEVKVMMVKDLQ